MAPPDERRHPPALVADLVPHPAPHDPRIDEFRAVETLYHAYVTGLPSEVARTMLRGRHRHNGVWLGNPRLGFVCTKQTMDGPPGLEGSYLEYDRELAPDERVRFAPGEDGPTFDPRRGRRARRGHRNGGGRSPGTSPWISCAPRSPCRARRSAPRRRGHLGMVTRSLIGMQYSAEVADLLGIVGDGPEAFAELLVRLGRAQGDRIDTTRVGDEIVIRQTTWRLMQDVPAPSAAVFDAWNALRQGALAVHNRHLVLDVRQRLDRGDPHFEWRVRTRRRRPVPGDRAQFHPARTDRASAQPGAPPDGGGPGRWVP